MFGWLKKSPGRSTPARSGGLAPRTANLAASRDEAQLRKAEGDAFLQAGNLAEAIRGYRRSLDLDPDQPGVRTPLAYALRDQGRPDEAAVELEIVLARDDRALDAHYLLGLIARDRGDTIAAIGSFERVLELDPGAVEVYRDLALLLVQGGRTREAREVLEKGIALHPGVADLHALSGNLQLHERQLEAAVASFDRALALHPEYPEAHYNRGIALQGLDRLDDALLSHDAALRARPAYLAALVARGELLRLLERPDDALASYEQALAIEPASAGVHLSRANMLLVLKRPADALAGFDQAIAIDPRLAAAFHNRGGALRALDRIDEALASYDQALALDPRMTQALIDKGAALRGLERPAEALASYELALKIDPGLADVLNNAALVLYELKRAEEALIACDRALALRPDFAEALNNRGLILQELNRPEEALASYDRALALNVKLADAHANRGNALQELVRHEEALASYERAFRIRADLETAYLNQSLSQLLLGQLPLGWQRYEWRWPRKLKRQPIRDFDRPMWLGAESLRGKTILLYAEQGLGDTIQFCRYAKCVADLGAKVELEVQPPLKALLEGLAGVARVIGRGEELPPFDFHTPLLSLPLAFGTTLESIPRPGAYLDVAAHHPARVRAWQARLGAASRPRIGLVWSGNPEHKRDAERSIALARFVRVVARGAEFVCLQPEVRAGDAPTLAAHPEIRSFCADLVDFVDTAALIEQLDLVISVDTSVAHLAGALGKDVWVLLTAHPDWRWLLGRSDTPWYERMRLFRQPTPVDWDDVLARLETEVDGFVANWAGAASEDRWNAR